MYLITINIKLSYHYLFFVFIVQFLPYSMSDSDVSENAQRKRKRIPGDDESMHARKSSRKSRKMVAKEVSLVLTIYCTNQIP